MAYVRVPDPLLDVNKPGRSVDWKQIRDNQDYFDAQVDILLRKTSITDQDIRDHFTAPILNTGNWNTKVGAGDTIVVAAPHTVTLTTNGVTVNDHAVLWATTNRQRIVKSEEYVAYCEARVKRTGGNSAHYVFGWNDDTLFGGGTEENGVTDQTDCVLVKWDGAGNWLGMTSLGAASSNTAGFGTGGNWSRIRMEFTCSATAGNRKVDFFLEDVFQATLNTDANIPAALLCPVIGIRGDNTGAVRVLAVDFVEFGFLTTPLAA